MIFTVEKSAILARLKRAKDATPRKTSRPIMTHVLLRATPEDGCLKIIGTDEETNYAAMIKDVHVEQLGRATAPAVDLLQVVNSLPSGPIRFSLDHESGEIVIQSGARIEFRLHTLNPDDYPDVDEMGEGEIKSAEISRNMLLAMIDGCGFAASQDEVRFYLGGIFFEMIRGISVATDGHRLAMTTNHPPVELPNLLVATRALTQIRDLLNGTTQETVLLAVSQKKLRLRLNDETFSSMLIEGSFPDYRQVIPKAIAQRWIAQRAALAEALKRVALLSPDKTGGVTLVADKAHECLRISSRHSGRGQSKEEVAVEGISGDFEIGINSAYLLDALSHIHTPKVSIEATNYLSPLKISPYREEDGAAETPAPSALHIVMPMRI